MIGKSKLATAFAVTLLAFGLWGCAVGGVSSSEQGAGGSSNTSGEAKPQEIQPEEAQSEAEGGSIYPWVVSKCTVENSSGLVEEYSYDYDGAGRLTGITGLQEQIVDYNTFGIMTVELAYDDAGDLTGIAPGIPMSGEYAIERNSDGLVSKVTHDVFMPGRMPDPGLHTTVVDYSYDADGELEASQSTFTYEEGGVSETESREYGPAADAEYDSMATSDGDVPLVEWNDERVMAGNGTGTGAIGEFDEHGNLVKAVIGGSDPIATFEYKQIEVERGWMPGPLSNPTLRTLGWNGLVRVNYLTFFPPQLDAAEIERVLEADTIDRAPTASNGALAGEASAGEESAGEGPEIIDAPGYTVTIPEELAESCYHSMEEGTVSQPTGFAYHATVLVDGDCFEVACISDDWGLQGNFAGVNLGPSSAMPGWNVWLYAAIDNGTDPEAYRDWVTVK